MEDLDKLYSPKCWSRRYPPDTVVQKHIEFVEAGSNKAKTTIPCTLGVKYGPTDAQRLDIFGEDSLPKDAPIFVFLHGGYWQALSRDMSSYCVPPLFKSGYRVIIVGYDLAPKVSLEDIIQETISAGKYILSLAQQYGSKSITLGGHCAGALMAFCLLTSEWFCSLSESDQMLFRGAVLISGIYDLAPLLRTAKNDLLQLTSHEIEAFSPCNIIEKLPLCVRRALQFVVVLAEYDSPAFYQQSQEFHKNLEKTSSCVDFVIIPKIDHFEIVENLINKEYSLTQKIINLLS